MTGKNKKQKHTDTLRLTYSALYLAIAMVLPLITGQIPEIGKALCPMHIPVLLCGFVCGWPWGLAVGLIAPLLRSVVFGMPVMFPGAVAMAFELATYGCLSGLLYHLLPKKAWCTYAVLVISMIAGRIVWGEMKDRHGNVILDKDGNPRMTEIFNFGKHKGIPVADVLQIDPGYYSWILSGDFTYNTKQVLTRIRLREANLNG